MMGVVSFYKGSIILKVKTARRAGYSNKACGPERTINMMAS